MNRPTKTEYQKLLTRYLEGKCSREEREALNRWYESFEQDGSNRIDISDTDNLLELKGEMFENIRKGIDELEAQSNNAPLHRETKDVKATGLRRIKRLAAVILAGIGIGIAIFSQHIFNRSRQVNNITVSERHAEERPKVSGPATIYLSDGSVVWLDGRSWLEYPGAFPDGIREVTLSGAAFFDVAKDSARLFVIHSTNFTTRVLGTSFKIKDHDQEESQEVEVVTGKVMVSVKDTATNSVKELILKSKRKAVYSKKDNSLIESVVKEDAVQALSTNSKLEFNEVALKDIVKVLNVVYGENITIASEGMKSCIITADLTHESLEVSIAILAKAVNADFTVRGKDIILSGEGCAAPQ